MPQRKTMFAIVSSSRGREQQNGVARAVVVQQQPRHVVNHHDQVPLTAAGATEPRSVFEAFRRIFCAIADLISPPHCDACVLGSTRYRHTGFHLFRRRRVIQLSNTTDRITEFSTTKVER